MICFSISKSLLILLVVLLSASSYAAKPNNSFCPRKGLPNVSTHLDCKVSLFADALYWYASEQTSSIWAIVGTTTIDPLIIDTWEAKNITFDWDFGQRVGAGYNLPYDKWDTKLIWTWFETNTNSTIPDTTGLISPQFFGAFVNGDRPLNGNLKWCIDYNMCDWELGRSYYVSKCLSLRPFIGLKGGWIFQTLRSNWQVNERDVDGVIVPVDYLANENVKNDFWGIGPLGGIETTWTLGCFKGQVFQLFGDFSTSLMWGTWSFKDVYQNPTPTKISTNVDDLNLGALSIHGFFGIGWKKCYKRLGIIAKLGYEGQLWINQVRFPTFQQVLLHGDLTLQGGTLHVQIYF